MFDTFVALGIIGIQLFLVVTIVAWLTGAPFSKWVAKNSSILLRIIFVGATLGSLIYSEVFGFAPCILCWYQRLAIFPITILLFTSNIAKSALLRLQILILSSAGLAIAIFQKYLELFPNSDLTVCGSDGVSCTVLYVFQFGYITIPMMSLTVLLSGVVLSLLANRFPQNVVAEVQK